MSRKTMDSDRTPVEDADLPDSVQYGESVERVWKKDGDWYGEDEHGEFNLDSGSPTPVSADDVGYDPCNCVLKFTFERYDERRYCTGMAGSNFNLDFDTCKHHKNRRTDEVMKARAEKFITGATAKSHESIYQYMEPHKRVVANELYKSLIGASNYNFDTETVELEIDVSDAQFGGDNDTLVMEHPIPSDKKMQCRALWFAALDFISMESMREEQFRAAAEDENVDAVGERWTVVASGENGPVYDKDEHHLNLPLSRLQKDYKQHLEFGGVTSDDDDGPAITEREYVLEVVDDEPPVEPEADTGEGTPLDDIDTPEYDE